MDKTKTTNNLKRSLKPEGMSINQDTTNDCKSTTSNNDELLETQSTFLSSLPDTVRTNFFSNQHVDPPQRATIWERQATIGEDLVNKFSWATPDARALKIMKHFGPIIEIGCGANAYWAQRMASDGIDIVAFDSHLDDGGKIGGGDVDILDAKESNKRRKCDGTEEGGDTRAIGEGFVVRKGGPEILSLDAWANGEFLDICISSYLFFPLYLSFRTISLFCFFGHWSLR